jgi:hypothetical protein
VNGKLVGTAWKPPYRVDISSAAKPSLNRLEIKVVNKWVNSLIGDAQPGVTQKITFLAADGKVPGGGDPAAFQRSLRRPYTASAPLVAFGFDRPVTVVERTAR